ncbi:hypothetical protein LPJ58_006890, partial [Coemansia sp. RSA 1591]
LFLIETEQTGRHAEDSLTVFVTKSVEQIIDADTHDLNNYKFLKLVAPEDISRVCVYIEQLTQSSNVLL